MHTEEHKLHATAYIIIKNCSNNIYYLIEIESDELLLQSSHLFDIELFQESNGGDTRHGHNT